MARKSKSKSSPRRNANHDRANVAIRTALVDSLWTCRKRDVARIRRAIRMAESMTVGHS